MFTWGKAFMSSFCLNLVKPEMTRLKETFDHIVRSNVLTPQGALGGPAFLVGSSPICPVLLSALRCYFHLWGYFWFDDDYLVKASICPMPLKLCLGKTMPGFNIMRITIKRWSLKTDNGLWSASFCSSHLDLSWLAEAASAPCTSRRASKSKPNCPDLFAASPEPALTVSNSPPCL